VKFVLFPPPPPASFKEKKKKMGGRFSLSLSSFSSYSEATTPAGEGERRGGGRPFDAKYAHQLGGLLDDPPGVAAGGREEEERGGGEKKKYVRALQRPAQSRRIIFSANFCMGEKSKKGRKNRKTGLSKTMSGPCPAHRIYLITPCLQLSAREEKGKKKFSHQCMVSIFSSTLLLSFSKESKIRGKENSHSLSFHPYLYLVKKKRIR